VETVEQQFVLCVVYTGWFRFEPPFLVYVDVATYISLSIKKYVSDGDLTVSLSTVPKLVNIFVGCEQTRACRIAATWLPAC